MQATNLSMLHKTPRSSCSLWRRIWHANMLAQQQREGQVLQTIRQAKRDGQKKQRCGEQPIDAEHANQGRGKSNHGEPIEAQP